ncbi:Proton-dependent oligopeptide transporter family [Dillenia turbinata]|uniref:Proton-dependent oligopeptide transporter family n=1 Tax=Dillenia turbinata TaxID=194707 RepID=A0AAN8Z1E8_9MAGN
MEKNENDVPNEAENNGTGIMIVSRVENEKSVTSESDDEPEINYRGIKVMPFIIGNETFEKLGAIGMLSNILVYLTTVFNMPSLTATTLVNVINGSTNFAGLMGAFVCDTYLGRYMTLVYASIASFLGLLLVALTAAIPKLHPLKCDSKASECTGATPGQMAFLLTGFGFVVLGAAGIRPCSLAFGADQFNPKTESGKRGANSFFNWYVFTYTLAQMVSLTAIVYVQSDVSWAIGLAIPALLMLLGCALFLMGTKLYVIVRPEGSPLTSIVQVLVVAAKKRRLRLPEQPGMSLFDFMPKKSLNSKLPYTDQFRFLNKAAIITAEDQINPDGSAANPWRLCSMQQVEETKCILRVLPIWASAILYYTAIVQQQTYATLQALQSNRKLAHTNLEIPASTYFVFCMLSLSLWIPIYDRIVVPTLRKVTGKEGGITLLQRMGIGIIENYRRHLALTKPIGSEPKRGAISSMSGSWLIMPLTLAGLAEAFTGIGQIEFYYKQFPENMRSIGGSLLFCGMATSSYFSGFLISIIHKSTKNAANRDWLPDDLNKGRLDYFYYLIASLGVMDFVYFLVMANWYKYKGTGNNINGVNMERKT